MKPTIKHVRNGEACLLSSIPLYSYADFSLEIERLWKDLYRPSAYFLNVVNNERTLLAVFASDEKGLLALLSAHISETTVPSLTKIVPALHLYERTISEKYGITFVGHPWSKPVRFPRPVTEAQNSNSLHIGDASFYCVEGDQIHEVSVGPVHAGVIEPGHFRFQCSGEEVLHLEISLGYQHRGIEDLLPLYDKNTLLPMLEVVAGDTTIGHALACAMALESLAHQKVPPRAQVLRGIALELERCANHVGDLGALAGDVGYLPTASFCGRIRGDFLNMTALLCGSRFGRTFITCGGVGYDCDELRIQTLKQRLTIAEKEFHSATELLWKTSSVLSRFEQTGFLSRNSCLDLGIVGVAARASGANRDVRQDFPSGIYQYSQIPTSVHSNGDVFSRAFVRWLEIQQSIAFMKEQLSLLPSGVVCDTKESPFTSHSLVVSLVEGWRGEICHVLVTNKAGTISNYSITDPSFHNWIGLALAMRNEQISDFPVCNKSFNLSYCGFDL